MAKPGFLGLDRRHSRRKRLPLPDRRKRWLTRRRRETMADYVQRTRRVFAWGSQKRNKNGEKAAGVQITLYKPVENVSKSPLGCKSTNKALAPHHLVGSWQNAIRPPYQGFEMARRSRDGTTKTGPFGPYRPMRGAWGQAVAIQTKVTTPTSPTEARLQPAGKSYELTYRGINKLRDWN